MDPTQPVESPPDPEDACGRAAAAASRSTWVSVGVNLVLTATQIAVGVLAKSHGLVADGIHSLSDLVADFVVQYSVRTPLRILQTAGGARRAPRCD